MLVVMKSFHKHENMTHYPDTPVSGGDDVVGVGVGIVVGVGVGVAVAVGDVDVDDDGKMQEPVPINKFKLVSDMISFFEAYVKNILQDTKDQMINGTDDLTWI